MRRRQALLTLPSSLGLAALGALGFGCRKDAGAAGKVKAQLNWVPEPEFGGLYAAREMGAYKKAGLDVELVAGGAGVPVIQLVGTGKVEFAIAGADDVVIARARGIDVVAVFATFQSSPLGVMVHEGRNVQKLDDLTSGTLAIEPGLPFGAWLKKKYPFKGVTLVPYDGGVAKFLADKQHAQQCYVTSEPIAVKKKGLAPKIVAARDTGFDPYAAVVVVRGALLQTKRELVRAFVGATAEGWKAYLADPKPANAVMGQQNPAMDAETFAAAAEAQRPLVAPPGATLGSMSEERFRTLAAQLLEIGLVDKAPPAGECFATV